MKKIRTMTALAVLAILVSTHSSAFGVTLRVGSDSGPPHKIVSIPITVNIPNGIAGAAFTIIFDKSLSVTIDSTFFDTFENQFAGTPAEGTNSVTVDSITYDQPLITNEATVGDNIHMMVAAARSTPADSSNSTLFTMHVSGTVQGTFPISVVSTTLNNTEAGYDAAGETIPMLIGSDLTKDVTDPEAFPILLNPPTVGTTIAGSVTISLYEGKDTDKDGMTDAYENYYGLNASINDASGDPDKDGLENLVEFLNQTNPRLSDTDGDGMPDGWEVAHNLDPLVNDASGDQDGDRFSNLLEYRKGTDPCDSNSCPIVSMPWMSLLLED